MQKIYYTSEGWVCERYPYNFERSEQYIEVDDLTYQKTLISEQYFAWKVVNGELLNERYEDTPKEEILQGLRDRRESECFSIINRGVLWYSKLTETQNQQLNAWYNAWLDITDMYVEGIDVETIIPQKPIWLN